MNGGISVERIVLTALAHTGVGLACKDGREITRMPSIEDDAGLDGAHSLWGDGGANNGCGGMQHPICVQLLPSACGLT